jgi:type IV secretion system protein VirD4
VPQIDVEQWWHAQNAARRAQGAVTTSGASAVRDVREHEIGVLGAAHFANRSSIRASLFQLMPYLREVLPEASRDTSGEGNAASPSIPEGAVS